MIKTLVLELVAFAIYWLMTPSIAPGAKLLGCAAGFLLGVGWGLLNLVLNQKPFWSPLAFPLGFFIFIGGCHLFTYVAFGAGMVLGLIFIEAGSARGGKSPPGKGPPTEVSPPQ